jgi:hypothetical protein
MSKAHAIAQEHRQCDKTRKPEQHRKRLCAQDTEFVVRDCVAEAPGHDTQVDEREDCPNGAEEEEVYLGGGHGVPVAGPPVGDWIGLLVVAWLDGG